MGRPRRLPPVPPVMPPGSCSALSQQGLARRAGPSRKYLARLETGQHNPSFETLQKLAKAVGVPVAALPE